MQCAHASEYPIAQHSKLNRSAGRGSYDKEAVHALIDEAPICYVGFVRGGRPFVIPTIHVRDGDMLYFHGANQSRLIHAIGSGESICVTFTILDGLVLARSALHHSMNYRSVVAFGTGELVESHSRKMHVFKLLVEKLIPGRSAGCRMPSDAERDATAVAGIRIVEASLKKREGPPADGKPDLELPYWAGVVPIVSRLEEPIADPTLDASIDCPDHVRLLV